MKKFKRIMALVIALAILATMSLSAFAANATPTGNLTPDTEMKVDGLDVGDSVKFVKLIKWVPNEGWKWQDGVENAATAAGVTLPALRDITGYLATDGDPTSFVEGKITAEQGGILAQVAQKLAAAKTLTVGEGQTSVTYTYEGTTDADQVAYMGLYVALVDPATAEYIYNPIFVAADYNPDSTNTNSIKVTEGTLSYSPEALAKKEKVTVTKTSGNATDVQYDVKLGDTIDFTITSVVPEYSSSYVEPVYEISDTMSEGLTLVDTDATNHSDIVVKVINSAASPADKADDSKWTPLSSAGTYPEYTITTTANGFTISLTSNYLKSGSSISSDYVGSNVAKDIKVTYKGKVTSIPDTNVVQKENTATVKFSNNPGDSSDYSLVEDKTNHYTFSLDANMLGKTNWENSELVKIGLSPDGTEITQSTLSNGTEAGILQGAKFGLYTDQACTQLYTNDLADPAFDGYVTSDSNGKLNISGLDAGIMAPNANPARSTGTYYLKELDAPAGYIASTDKWEIVITANYGTEAAGSYNKTINGKTVKVNYDAYDYLTDYSVKVKNLATNQEITSGFTISNEGAEKKIAVSTSGDMTTKLNNTRGTELPSTGGIGTTIFYVVGALLVIGAGVILITRRRMEA